ncbi:MAG: NADP(H)-dependent aldo-keto reductase [Oligoflexales bacterium]|nr:NADP(H)-dependent aldo-keto reductase [Oligoflexales bacterium]
MEMRKLGDSGIEVSSICLGTMTFGEQNSLEDAFEQLDYAIEHGVNFVDTAEMYPVPPKKETYSLTEEYIGKWLHSRGNRDRIVLASKVVGPAATFTYVRDGKPRLNRKNIETALDASLKRLQTDYLDLYQLHWPDRSTNFFGRRSYEHDSSEDMTPIEETLEVLNDCVAKGKVRTVGLSNETPWGAMKFLQIAKEKSWPKVVSIQNPYNLLNRIYEIGLAEVSCRENCGLLTYSPLAFGVLSGKYLGGKKPEGARVTIWERFSRYSNENGFKATERYVELANFCKMDPSQMAIAFCLKQPFMTSVIIGATTMEQLKVDIASAEVNMSEDLMQSINSIHQEIPNPCP